MGTQLAAIQAVQDLLATISGVKHAPDFPPEQMTDFPFIIAYPGSGSHAIGAMNSGKGERKFLGAIIVEIHIGRKELPIAVASAIGFGDSIPDKLLANPTLNGTVDTFESVVQEFFGELDWGDIKTIGFRFSINNVKIRTTIT